VKNGIFGVFLLVLLAMDTILKLLATDIHGQL
jgi:hypothetical protein